MLKTRIQRVDGNLAIITKEGTATHLNELEECGLSFIPIGSNGKPKLKYAELRNKGEQIKVSSFNRSDEWWEGSVYGIKIMTGPISKRAGQSAEHYLVDIDIEAQMVENHNDLVQDVWDLYKSRCKGTPFLVHTKSGGRRISAWSSYSDKVVKFVDTSVMSDQNRFPMAMEIMSENGMSRYDERYEIVKGSLTDLPHISREGIDEIIEVVQNAEGIGRLAYRKGTKKDVFIPEFDVDDFELPHDIEWVDYGKSQVSRHQYRCIINPNHENDDTAPSMSYWNNPDGSIATFCFKCDFGINLKKSDREPHRRRKPPADSEEEPTEEFDESELGEDFDPDDLFIGNNEPQGNPEIFTNFQYEVGNKRPDPVVLNEALEALINSNLIDPEVFHRGGRLCQVRADELNQLKIEELSVHGVRSRLAHAADWYKWELQGRGENKTSVKRNVSVPVHITQYLMSTEDLGKFHALQGIVNHPVLRDDGTWHSLPGYDERTQYYVNPQSVVGLENKPMSVDEAKALIFDELLFDFPFESDASLANAIAFALNPLIRTLVGYAPTPLFVFDAPVSRTGKGLLVDTLHRVVTGLPVNVSTPAENEEEWEKRIITSLMAGSEVVFYDEVETTVTKRLRSGKLGAAITANQFGGRLLGSNTLISVPVRCTWVIAGNNILLGEDLLNRSVFITLVSNTENPEDRDPNEFKHNLPSWATQNRNQLLSALMTFIDEWIRQGSKRADVRLAGFEDWVQITAGILDSVGIKGLLQNRSDIMARVNTGREEIKKFVLAVVEEFGENPWFPGDVGHIATFDDDDQGLNLLGDFIYAQTYRGRIQKVGHFLRKTMLRATYAGYRLHEWQGANKQGRKYVFKHVEEPEQPVLFEEIEDENTEVDTTPPEDDIPF